jgi:hypothetical protein
MVQASKTCPFHGGPIVSKCKITSCDLWVPGAPCKCALKATSTHAAAADLLKVDNIKPILEDAYELLKSAMVEGEYLKSFTLAKGVHKCVVCGSKKVTITQEGWAWCSSECFTWSPPALLKLEARWGVPANDLLFKWRHLKHKTLARLLGLDFRRVESLLWQRLGFLGDEKDQPKQWRKTNQGELEPNRELPSKKALLSRLKATEKWK